MFIVFNKRKICSYLVAFSTVVILFAIAFSTTNGGTIITSSTVKELPIYNVETTDKKVALTMNCAWNANDIDSILKTLKEELDDIIIALLGEYFI